MSEICITIFQRVNFDIIGDITETVYERRRGINIDTVVDYYFKL